MWLGVAGESLAVPEAATVVRELHIARLPRSCLDLWAMDHSSASCRPRCSPAHRPRVGGRGCAAPATVDQAACGQPPPRAPPRLPPSRPRRQLQPRPPPRPRRRPRGRLMLLMMMPAVLPLCGGRCPHSLPRVSHTGSQCSQPRRRRCGVARRRGSCKAVRGRPPGPQLLAAPPPPMSSASWPAA